MVSGGTYGTEEIIHGAGYGRRNHGVYGGLLVVVMCAALNLAGSRVVGITSLWLFFLLSAPFAVIVVMSPLKMGTLAEARAAPSASGLSLLGGVLGAMWN